MNFSIKYFKFLKALIVDFTVIFLTRDTLLINTTLKDRT